MPFLDRQEELVWLQEGWDSGKAQFRILYGRRRVGKSALLDQFAAGKRKVVYQAVEGTTTDQLRDLTQAVLQCGDDPLLQAAPLANWGQALATFTRMAGEGQLLVVLDEFQYAAQADPTLSSLLQRWWSREASHLPIYLVLCGSYIRFFAENVLTGPAYGRNTGALQLLPLGYRQAAEFFPGWSNEDRLRAYAAIGGVPHYILQFDPKESLSNNIIHNLLRRGSVLYQEAELLVREELREPRLYFSILRALAEGATRISEIAARTGHGGDVSPYLRNLEALGLARYQTPLAGKARRGIWRVADPYLGFWFRFVLPNRTLLEHGASPEQVYRQAVQPRLDHFVSRPAFEEVCRDWAIQQSGRGVLPGFSQVGAWWGPIPNPTPENPRNRSEAEIEVVGLEGSRLVLAGEAKWSREAVGFGTLNRLREVARQIPGFSEETRLLLFGRTFEPRLADAAEAEGVTLVSVDDLYQG